MSEQQQRGDFFSGLVLGAVIGGAVGTVIGLTLGPRLLKRKSRLSPSLNAQQLTSSEGFPLSSTGSTTPSANSEAEAEKITQVRRSLEEKIAKLNDAIQDTRSQLLVNPKPSQPQP